MLDLISASLGSPTFRAVAPAPDKVNLGDATLPDGTKMIGPGGFLAPPARQFSMIVNAATRMYSYRFDEAMRDNFVSARAMRRDAFVRGLLEERILPTINRSYQLEVDDDRDPSQIAVRDALLKLVKAIPDFDAFKRAQLDAVWFGRAGCQWGFQRSENHSWMWGIPRWDPVHGDSVQFTFDGIPAILLDTQTVGWYAQHGATYGPVGKGDLVPTDRGGTALVLHRPYWRDRFSVHRHILEKADYFEGELAGSSQGLGIRGLIYWQYVVRTDALTWMLAYMQAVGQMDLLVFNYPSGDAEAKSNQENNARKIIGKAALACPRNPNGNWPAVEQIQMNSAGLKALHDLVADYFDRHIERIIVGQSMSSGADKGDGLGGTGRAEFAKACVPVDGSEILTRAGFKSPEDVQVGEEVLAYDADTDRCRWTPLLKKSFFEDCPIVRMHTEQNRFEAVCTPDHSWAVEATAYGSDGGDTLVGPRGGVKPASQKRFLQKAHDLRSRDNIVLAAREDETTESLLTPTEAAILGWVVTDGTVRRYDGRFSGTRYSVGICQSKKSNFETIRKLMVEYTGTTHETVVETKQRTFPMNGVTYATKPQHWWYLPREIGTRLLKKAGFWDRSDLPGIVTRLSGPARKAMLDAMLSADGHVGSQIVFTNTDPHIIEALEILCALEGLATGATRAKPRDGRYKTCFDKGIKTTRLAYGAHIQQEDVGTADVWCPTTKYGTWVMRQNGRVMVTGNTKDEILIYDTNRLDATLTTNLIAPLKKYNFGKAKFPVRFKSILPNLEADNKVSSGLKLIQVGVPIKVDELRDAAGYSRPDQGDDVIGMPQPMMPPGGAPGAPGAPPGAAPPAPGPGGPGAVYSGGASGVAHQLPPGAAPPPVAFSARDHLPLRGPVMPISAVEKYPNRWPQQYQRPGAVVKYGVGDEWESGETQPLTPDDAAANEPGGPPADPTYDAMLKAVHANPFDATAHLALADLHDERGDHDEAAFRRDLGTWFQSKFMTNPVLRPHRPDRDMVMPWSVLSAKTRVPKGINPDDIERLPGWGSLRSDTPDHVGVPLSADGQKLHWREYAHMEEALRRAFMKNLQRQRAKNPTQASRYAEGAAPAAGPGTSPAMGYPGGGNTYLPKREDETVVRTTRYAGQPDVPRDDDGFVVHDGSMDRRAWHTTGVPGQVGGYVMRPRLDRDQWVWDSKQFDRRLAKTDLHDYLGVTPDTDLNEHRLWNLQNVALTPHELWAWDLPGGEAPPAREAPDWRPNETIPEDFYGYRRVGGPVAYDEPKYASTQVNLTGPACIKVASLAWAIPDDDLHEKGREDEPHVTVRYGLHDDDPQPVAALLAGVEPVKLTLGKVSYFSPEGKDYDVVKIDVTSPDLKKINAKLGQLKNTQTFTYKPHATVAYVKRGLGKKWADVFGPAEIEFVADAIVFSPKDRQNKVFITLDPHAKVPEGAKQLTAYRRGAPVRYGDREGFEAAIDENPIDTTNHLVFADWLDENGDHDEAEFRRNLANWMTADDTGFEHLPTEQHPYHWAVSLGTNVKRYPDGVGQEHIPSHVPVYETEHGSEVPRIIGGRLRWGSYRGMEQAFRNAFRAARAEKYANGRIPTQYDTGAYNATRGPAPMLDTFKPLDAEPEYPEQLPSANHVPHLGHPERAFLTASPIVRAAPVGHPDEDDDMDDEDAARPGMSESWRLHYPDRTGAIFKPGRGEPPLRRAILPGTGHRREVAASVAADILGLDDLVPRTSFRSLEGRNGSVQQWLQGHDTGFNAPHRIRFGGTPEETARAAAFDYLIGHADRHKNNWLVDPQSGKLKLIDNGLSFPKFHTAQDFRNRELLNMAVKGGYKLPAEVKDYGRHWDELEAALRGLGIEDDAVKMTKERMGHLVNKWHHKFSDLPAHWL